MSESEVEIVARRLVEHFQGNVMEGWLENPDEPLAASVYTAPIRLVAEGCLANPSQERLWDLYAERGEPNFDVDSERWTEARQRVESQLDGDETCQSALDPVDAITADAVIAGVSAGLNPLIEACQEDRITSSVGRFQVHPIARAIDV